MWKNEPPGEVGWYWFKLTDPHVPEEIAKPKLLLVYEWKNGSMCAEDTVNHERYSVCDMAGLWAGPLAPPEAT